MPDASSPHSTWDERRYLERHFNEAACERLARANRDYQQSHAEYIVPLAKLLNVTRSEKQRLAEQLEAARSALEAVIDRAENGRSAQRIYHIRHIARAGLVTSSEGAGTMPDAGYEASSETSTPASGAMMPGSIRVVPSHPATAKAWEWLKHGDGRFRSFEQHQRIQTILLDLDELLNELDRETSSSAKSRCTCTRDGEGFVERSGCPQHSSIPTLCPKCGGTGEDYDWFVGEPTKCSKCNGSGAAPSDND